MYLFGRELGLPGCKVEVVAAAGAMQAGGETPPLLPPASRGRARLAVVARDRVRLQEQYQHNSLVINLDCTHNCEIGSMRERS